MWPAPYWPPPWPTGNAKLDAERMEAYSKERAEAARMNRNIGIGVVTFFVLAMGGLIFLIGSPTKSTPPAVPIFNPGDTVKMKLDGRAGMVLSTWCGKRLVCEYKVRFSAASLNTDVHLLAPDGAVVSGAYSDVWVREFELEGRK